MKHKKKTTINKAALYEMLKKGAEGWARTSREESRGVNGRAGATAGEHAAACEDPRRWRHASRTHAQSQGAAGGGVWRSGIGRPGPGADGEAR